MKLRKSLSRSSWQDMYYDGFIEDGRGFDEESGEVFVIPDFWNLAMKDYEERVKTKGNC